MEGPSGQSPVWPLRTSLNERILAGEWILDPHKSSVRLKSRSMWGLAPVNGVFRQVKGEGALAPQGAVSGTVTIAASSIDTKSSKRDRHLCSPDFFDAERYPDIVFALNDVQTSPDGVTVTGVLTVRGRTLPVSFDAQVAASEGDELCVDAEVSVNRADFGLTWNQLGMASMHNILTIHAAVFTRRSPGRAPQAGDNQHERTARDCASRRDRPAAPDRSLVADLYDLRCPDASVVGTKAAHLARLAGLGFRVPEGFVITATACDRVLAAAGQAGGAGVGPGIPADVWAQVRSNLGKLGDGAVAVRSSGTAEDLTGASYAGQYETVLGVQGPAAVADAIGRCLASASSGQVRAYQASEARAPMAVLVQRMVPADAAGVAFTANPVSGDAEVLVSAVKGLGDRLVSGQATPDEWVIRGDGASCLRSPEGALGPGPAAEIAVLARSVEEVFGCPQDIEWAIAGGELFVLQARPITALPVAPDFRVPREGFWQKDTAHFTHPITPFGASVILPALSAASRPVAAEFGLLFDGMEARSLGGEVYMHAMPPGGKKLRSAPPPWVIWVAARLVPQLRRRARAAQAAITSGLPERILGTWESEQRAAFAREIGELRRADLATLSDAALLAHLECVKGLLARGEEVHFRLLMPYALALRELAATCRDLFGWDTTRGPVPADRHVRGVLRTGPGTARSCQVHRCGPAGPAGHRRARGRRALAAAPILPRRRRSVRGVPGPLLPPARRLRPRRPHAVRAPRRGGRAGGPAGTGAPWRRRRPARAARRAGTGTRRAGQTQ